MRALCGAIITAGAVIALGLTAIGLGTRYQTGLAQNWDKDGNPYLVHLSQIDRPMVFIIVFLVCVAVIGLGIAFLGLAYHHHRRYLEIMRDHPTHPPQRTAV
jgi:hypothetical protein